MALTKSAAHDRTFSGASMERLRQAKGLTQREMALGLGVTEATYRNWASGRTNPDSDFIPKIMGMLTCSFNDLYE